MTPLRRMNLVRRLFLRLRVLFDKSRLDGEMDEELGFHLEMETKSHIRAGMSPEEAERAALSAVEATR